MFVTFTKLKLKAQTLVEYYLAVCLFPNEKTSMVSEVSFTRIQSFLKSLALLVSPIDKKETQPTIAKPRDEDFTALKARTSDAEPTFPSASFCYYTDKSLCDSLEDEDHLSKPSLPS